MTHPARRPRAAPSFSGIFFLPAAAVIGAVVAASGCQSNCRSNCPPAEVFVTASPGENLDLDQRMWQGPACRYSADYCTPDYTDPTNFPCVSFRIVGFGEGVCEVSLTFKDGRPPITIHAEFGPPTTVGCCHGYPALTPSTVVIPPLHADGGAGRADGDADGDAGGGADDGGAGADGGAGEDRGADAEADVASADAGAPDDAADSDR